MNDLCNDHLNQKVTHICTYNHVCQKRLCDICLKCHIFDVPSENLLTINKCLEKQQGLIEKYKLNDECKLKDFEEDIQHKLDKIHNKFLEWIKLTKSCINKIIQQIKDTNQSYKSVLEQHPLECPQLIVHAISYNLQEYPIHIWSKESQTILNNCNRKFDLLVKSFDKLIDIANQEVYQITTFYDGTTTLEGFKILGVKHGQYNQILETGEMLDAGQYGLNKKIGVWKFQGWHEIKNQLQQTIIEVNFCDEIGIKLYKKNNQIIKIEHIENEIMLNIEQIKYLSWKGNYDLLGRKIGVWNANWKGQDIGIGGLYDTKGYKIGIWKESLMQYSHSCQTICSGEYKNGMRFGRWDILFKTKYMEEIKIIGGGFYNDHGMKEGIWEELFDNFSINNQVIQVGQYRQGQKFGKWSILFREYSNFKFKYVGGGMFEQDKKIQQWTELDQYYGKDNEIIQVGCYKEGIKIDRWDIKYREDSDKQFQILGGGEYDDKGIKIGQWKQINNHFSKDNQIILIGNYRKGKKFGRWDTYYKQSSQFQLIAGGDYDDAGLQIGNWIEIDEFFKSKHCQFTLIGQYQDGKKVGRWDILSIQNRNSDQYLVQIYMQYFCAGGNYNLQGQKFGKWIELDYRSSKQLQFLDGGEYINGKKEGLWVSQIQEKQKFQIELVIGGEYQADVKTGKWIEFADSFNYDCQVIEVGVYKNGNRSYRWDVQYRNQQEQKFQTIAGGNYDLQGNKIGKWTELDTCFKKNFQVIHEGQYENNMKNGKWNTQFREVQNKKFDIIAEGSYSNDNKIGKWIELEKHYQKTYQVIYDGQYQNGIKIGKWDILYRYNTNQEFITMAGGFYDVNGLKNGKWCELGDYLEDENQVIFIGEYSDGKKFGRWNKNILKVKEDELQIKFLIQQVLIDMKYLQQIYNQLNTYSQSYSSIRIQKKKES
ncbi:unnamed protein product [Paramecium primaurelia]|uniref:Uncharacterized protein n=1 Tax=Paramecium primaurelia TaxID=5886 RepID=A0A8S1LNS2_PARPR|nr:unnamed protein product [Paramecium primaurelia]